MGDDSPDGLNREEQKHLSEIVDKVAGFLKDIPPEQVREMAVYC